MADFTNGYQKDWLTFVTSTLEYFADNGEPKDNAFKATPTLSKLALNREVPYEGGSEILVPVILADNTPGGFFSGYDKFDRTPAETTTVARYKIGRAVKLIEIANSEYFANRGAQENFNLLRGMTTQASMSMGQLLSTNLHSTSDASDGKKFLGLGAAVPVDPTTTSIGGIAATITNWQSQYSASAVNFGTGSSPTTAEALMSQLKNAARWNGGEVDLIVMGETLYSAFEKAWMSRGQNYGGMTDANSGVTSIRFGSAEVVLDKDCAASTILGLTKNSFQWRPLAGRNFSITGPIPDPNSDTRTFHLIVEGQLVCNQRRNNYRASAVSAA